MDVQYKREERTEGGREGGLEGRKEGGRERIHSDSNDLDLEGWHCKWLSLGVTTAILGFFEEITNLDFFFYLEHLRDTVLSSV